MPSETGATIKAPKASVPTYDGSCYFAENSKWVPGRIVDFVGSGQNAVVATSDGRLVSVKLSDIRHGTEEPAAMPHLMSVNADGKRQHTIKRHHDGKWIVASPDGVIKGEYEDEESAKAKHGALENPVSIAPPSPAKPWKEAS